MKRSLLIAHQGGDLMKRLILALVALSVAAPAMAQVQVKGYTRKDGTYVAPHYRSSPQHDHGQLFNQGEREPLYRQGWDRRSVQADQSVPASQARLLLQLPEVSR